MSSKLLSKGIVFSLSILVLSTSLWAAGSEGLVARDVAAMTDIEVLARVSPPDVLAFRENLQEVLATQREIIALTGQRGLLESVDQRLAAIARVSDADMARLMLMGVDFTPLREAVSRLDLQIQQSRADFLAQAAKIAPASDTLPNAGYSFCGSNRQAADGMFAGQVVLDVAKGVWSVASRGCDQVAVVAGFGANTSLVCIIVDTVLYVAEAVMEGIKFCDADIDSAEIEGSYERLGHVHEDLEDAESTIVSNDNTNKQTILNQLSANVTTITNAIDANTTTIINNDNANKNTIISNDNANTSSVINNDNTNTSNIITNDNSNRDTIINNDNSNRDLIIGDLRRVACDIIRLLHTPEGQRSSNNASCVGEPGFPYDFPEKKIAFGGETSAFAISLPRPSQEPNRSVTMETHLLEGRMVPSYYLPSTRGGLIEQVKLLVWTTITSHLELDIAPAETATARGAAAEADQLLEAQQYVSAYRSYARAYQQLIPAN